MKFMKVVRHILKIKILKGTARYPSSEERRCTVKNFFHIYIPYYYLLSTGSSWLKVAPFGIRWALGYYFAPITNAIESDSKNVFQATFELAEGRVRGQATNHYHGKRDERPTWEHRRLPQNLFLQTFPESNTKRCEIREVGYLKRCINLSSWRSRT